MTDPAVWPVARLRQIGGAAWIGAAALAVIGSFLPLYEQRYGPASSYTMSVWGFEAGGTTAAQDNLGYPPVGVPLMVGAVLLAAAGLLAMASTRLHPASGPVLAARLIGTGAAGLTAGASVLIFIATKTFDGTPAGAPEQYAHPVGFGTWLMLGSILVSLAAIALMLVPRLGKRGGEPETPPMGIPVVRVLEPEYEETDPKG
ncbi:MAG: hypothetical protein ABW224_21685 [Kibdelosporangium sp.]